MDVGGLVDGGGEGVVPALAVGERGGAEGEGGVGLVD